MSPLNNDMGMKITNEFRELFDDPNVPEFKEPAQLLVLIDKVIQVQSDCTTCLKMAEINKTTKENINDYVLEQMTEYKNCSEMVELDRTLKMGYYFKYIFQQINTISQSLGPEKFQNFSEKINAEKYQNFSAGLKKHSVNALKECFYENVGLKSLKLFPEAYFKMNISDEWKNEIWWIKGIYKEYFLDDDAKKAISNDSRTELKVLVEHFVNDVCNFLKTDEEIDTKVSEVAQIREKKVDKKIDKIRTKAHLSYLNMEPMKHGIAKYKRLIRIGSIDGWPNEIVKAIDCKENIIEEISEDSKENITKEITLDLKEKQ